MQEFLLKSLDVLIGIGGAVMLFGVAVFVHELGHFVAAKRLGVGVSKFALGFGPKIVAWVRGETEYSIRWFPLGGFVSLKGMLAGLEDEESKPAGEEKGDATPAPAEEEKEKITSDLDALRDKPAHLRIAVFAAGVTMNFISAMVVMVFFLWYGTPKTALLPNVLNEVPETSYIHAKGWRTGDRIVAVEGLETADWDAMEKAVGEYYEALDGDDGLSTPLLTVERGDETLQLPYPVPLLEPQDGVIGWFQPWFFPYSSASVRNYRYFLPPFPALVEQVVPRSAADQARLVKDDYRLGEEVETPLWDDMAETPLEKGDVIVEVNGEEVPSWNAMERHLHRNPDAAISLGVRRGEKLMLLNVVLEHQSSDPTKGLLGITRGYVETSGRDRFPLWEAAVKAPGATVRLAGRLIYRQVEFFMEHSGEEIGKQVGGPILIGKMAYKSAQAGLSQYMYLFMAISIILAIMNLLPIPILDGGYILITCVESVIRRPIPEKVLVPILSSFMFLFMVFFVLIFYNDFRNW